MTTLPEVYDVQPELPALDSWVHVLTDVAKLAHVIAPTNLVPQQIRGDEAAVTAVVMFGREVGLPPMTALRVIYTVRGNVELKAEAMLALVLARGHEVSYVTSDDAQCVVRGRRAGQTAWHEVRWTLAHAHRAQLADQPQWQKYPRVMLKHAATRELCRDIFADALGGFMAADDVEEPEPQKPARGRRVRRNADVVRELKPAPDPASPEPLDTPRATSVPAMPPLPGEDAAVSPPVAAAPQPPPIPDPPPVAAATWPEAMPPPPVMITPAQLRALHAALGRIGVGGDRERGLSILAAVVRHPVESSKDLTADEAGAVITTLDMAANSADPQASLEGLMRLYGMSPDRPLPFDEPDQT